MFELYDIYDTSEITIIVLLVLIFILGLIIFMIFLFSNNKNKFSIKEEIENITHRHHKKDDIDYKKKYEELMKEKGDVNINQLKYSPSEFSTLLKYNPILPYSAFTWDIINNAYLDFNEQSNYNDNNFSLNNYDNIYKSSSDTDKINRIMQNIKNYKESKNSNNNNNNDNGLLDQEYMKKDLY